MKVYQVKELGETTYFCFDGGKKEAKDWHVNECMCDESEISSLIVFPRKKWKEITIKYEENEIEYITMDEYMQGQTWAEVICSSAYL